MPREISIKGTYCMPYCNTHLACAMFEANRNPQPQIAIGPRVYAPGYLDTMQQLHGDPRAGPNLSLDSLRWGSSAHLAVDAAGRGSSCIFGY